MGIDRPRAAFRTFDPPFFPWTWGLTKFSRTGYWVGGWFPHAGGDRPKPKNRLSSDQARFPHTGGDGPIQSPSASWVSTFSPRVGGDVPKSMDAGALFFAPLHFPTDATDVGIDRTPARQSARGWKIFSRTWGLTCRGASPRCSYTVFPTSVGIDRARRFTWSRAYSFFPRPWGFPPGRLWLYTFLFLFPHRWGLSVRSFPDARKDSSPRGWGLTAVQATLDDVFPGFPHGGGD